MLVHTLDAQTARRKALTDSEILGQVQKTFHDDHAFIGSSILPSVNHGVFTLSGNVRSEAERTLASSELASIDGVKTVLNNLNIVDNTFHAPPPPKPVAGPSGPKLITLPAGSAVPVRVTDEIDTKTAKAGDTFHGTTATSVTMNGFTLIPAGTPVMGRVTLANRYDADPSAVETFRLFLPNGDRGYRICVWSNSAPPPSTWTGLPPRT